jgi:hypothetical protein
MTDATPSPFPPLPLRWALAISVLAIGAILAADALGRASRRLHHPGPGESSPAIRAVESAADAYRVWRSTSVRGRRLVVLTGQWTKPRRTPHVPTVDDLAASGLAAIPDTVDVRGALFEAARAGVVRRLDIVMPPAAFTHRIGEVSAQKELERTEGAFRLPYNGLDRRFSTARAFAAPREVVLVLVEPSWFEGGAPSRPLEWLAARGVAWDLALLALDDPGASEDERRAAADYALTVGALAPSALP